uniref:Chromo domain-containing protein n=1 Tax=Ditylenchus dipsaci TaxID=166011 RepID=A0A915EPW2_9BILA
MPNSRKKPNSSGNRLASRNNQYAVEKILDKKYDHDTETTMYLLKWEGYDDYFNSWQNEKELTSCEDLSKSSTKDVCKRSQKWRSQRNRLGPRSRPSLQLQEIEEDSYRHVAVSPSSSDYIGLTSPFEEKHELRTHVISPRRLRSGMSRAIRDSSLSRISQAPSVFTGASPSKTNVGCKSGSISNKSTSYIQREICDISSMSGEEDEESDTDYVWDPDRVFRGWEVERILFLKLDEIEKSLPKYAIVKFKYFKYAQQILLSEVQEKALKHLIRFLKELKADKVDSRAKGW